MPDHPEKPSLASYRSRLGTVPDQQIADLVGVSRTLVVNYRKKLGIPAYSGYRTPAPQPKPEAETERPFRGRRSALDAHIAILGKMPDAEVAKLAQVTAENVRTYRQRRGIPAQWQRAQEEPQAAAPPAAVPAASARPSRPQKAEATPPPTVTPPAEPAAVTTAQTPRFAEALPQTGPPAPSPAASVTAPATAVGGPPTLAWLISVLVDAAPSTYVVLAPDIASAAAEARARVLGRFPSASVESIQRIAELLAK